MNHCGKEKNSREPYHEADSWFQQHGYDVTSGQRADLDWLLYNAPMEYASLVLSGETGNCLKEPVLHGIED